MAEVVSQDQSQREQIHISFKSQAQANRINFVELEKSLTCGVCRELFNEPVTLFCNHTFCHSCILNLKQDWQGRQCPLCQTKVWQPSLKTVNFVIRDMVKSLFGEERYQKAYEERQKTILKNDLKTQVVQEIKEEMWRSISDNLNNYHNPKENNQDPILPPPIYTTCINYNSLQGCSNGEDCKFRHTADSKMLMDALKQIRKDFADQIPPSGQAICYDFNKINGCPNGNHCQYAHVYNIKSLVSEFKWLQKKFGYLFPPSGEEICVKYNTVKGCSLGEACEYQHVPSIKTLLDEIAYHRDNSLIIRKDDLVLYFASFMVMMGFSFYFLRKK